MPVSSRFHTILVLYILADDSIEIPVHQRPEIWDNKRKRELIDTIFRGLPMPPLVFRETINNGKRTRWLEDGQQRYWSCRRYTEDKFSARTSSGEYKFYSELNADEKASFNFYQMPVLTYENASEEDSLRIFQYLQNGVPLKSGQRFHAIQSISPIVSYAIDTFLMYKNQRVAKVFGLGTKPVRDTSTKKMLENAMALAGGLIIGPGFITTSHDILGPRLTDHIPQENVQKADTVLNHVLDIYESVQIKSAWNNKELKKYNWPVGKITGYILWSVLICMSSDGDNKALAEGWVKFLLEVRANPKILKILHKDKPSSRNWTSQRWSIGFENIFSGGPAAAVFNEEILLENISGNNDNDNDTDDDDESI